MKITKALGYARVSTKLQIEGKEFDSIEAQSSIISGYVKSKPNMELLEIFTDPGKSGKNMNRPGLKALIERVKRGDIDYVISYRLDRISRDNFDYFEFEKIVSLNKVKVIYTNDFNPDSSAFGTFTKTLMVALAQLERGQTVQRIKDKHTELLKQGYHPRAYPPLGYTYGEKKNTLAVEPLGASHVKKIFSLYIKGKRPSDIAGIMLKEYGCIPKRKTRNGKEYGGSIYSENYVRRILENPVYAGYVYEKGKGEFYNGLHEALISKKDWEKVKEKLQVPLKKRLSRIRNCEAYLLKGILFCECGSAMTCGSSGKVKKDGLFYYYICSGRNRERRGRSCQTGVSTKILESVLCSALGHIATRNMSPKDIAQNISLYEERILKEQKNLKALRNRKNSELQKMISRFGKIEGNDVLNSALSIEIQKASEEIEKLNGEISKLALEIEAFESKETLPDLQVKSLIENLDALQNELSASEKRALVSAVVAKLKLSLKNKKGYKRNLKLSVQPTPEYADRVGELVIDFEVDTSRGKSEWKITSPFEISCDNYEDPRPKKSRKIKRHWLHKVIRWQSEIKNGKTLEDISKSENLSKSMVCRKLKLLERLNKNLIKEILSLRYESDTSKYTFRLLDAIAMKESF